ncbi:hypothetical protein MNBD_GAMMA11-2058 [hydrothermal vent metagenome]|uniref:Uncharacterized protein n=1 Tax=hydrothermal vent metagenome TaxID=652676 RepID=A0A3B0X9R1_9ZZZZ
MPVLKFYNRLSPFQCVIIALLPGKSTDFFFGKAPGSLQIADNAYIHLLQMMLLPYLLLSSIGNSLRYHRRMQFTGRHLGVTV